MVRLTTKSWFAIATLGGLMGVSPANAQSAYVSITDSHYEIDAGGVITPFVSGLNDPEGLTFDSAGTLYASNYAVNTVSKITPSGAVSTFATGFNKPDGLAIDAGNNVYVANFGSGDIDEITPGGAVTLFSNVGGSAVDLVVTAVPVPTDMALMLSGVCVGGGFWTLRKRRRK